MKKISLLRVIYMIAFFAITISGVSLVFASDASATCHGSGGVGKGKCTFAGRCGAVYPGETSDCDGDNQTTITIN
ncbi:hypothetical protein [Pedobacter sp. N23S346]|uniref:hypothetical protein n=1 Tax=Pedobacter sp. N23S346 TaxID=3402750 RepID=UPI003AC4376C